MTAYYNEFDRHAAAWLRELIARGEIAEGIVDERSITELDPADLAGFRQCHFFAGIGGWSRALRLAGWPDDRPVWTGSCPCQPFSAAGKQLGTADDRHLWPVWFDLIRKCRPAIIVGEQVASKVALGWWDGVCDDLEGEGYACAAADLCAASCGAPHIRQRLYWVAHLPSGGLGADGRTSGPGGHDDECGESQRLDDAHLLQREQPEGIGARPREAECERSHRKPSGSSSPRGLGNLLQPRRQGGIHWRKDQARTDQLGHAGCDGPTFWSAYDLIPCRDGKLRRTGPGIHPLVQRVADAANSGREHEPDERRASVRGEMDQPPQRWDQSRNIGAVQDARNGRSQPGSPALDDGLSGELGRCGHSGAPQAAQETQGEVAGWPTCTKGDSASARNATASRTDPDSRHHAGTTLTDAAELVGWPTPNTPSGGRSVSIEAMDATGRTSDGRKHTASLEHAVKFASGIPNATAEARVMRLRGYGNAIVPPLAAEFIRAVMDAKPN